MSYMIENDHVVLWNRCLNIIRDNVPDTTYKTWFEPIVPLKYEDHALTIGVPSPIPCVPCSDSRD